MIPTFGAIPHHRGTTFRLWAPAQREVALVLDGGRELPMERHAEGFFLADVPDVGHGHRYRYRIRQGLRADPASRYQPEGPLGPSEVVDSSTFGWTDERWPGVPAPHRHVFYEMHVGTFTQEGTWDAAAARLPDLVDIGVTTLEVMPLAAFAGRFGWGYDGVHLFAPTHLYGPPDAARRFVDEAHRLGLAVILDVVYNHFGPVGNFFPEFSETINGAPGEWGDSINYDGPGSGPVREFMKDNAAYWIREFHFDGLRLDAVHAINDASPEHVVSEICRAARDAAAPRELMIVAECESQDTRFLKGTGAYADGVDAIWNEDWHHAAYVTLTGRRQAYFSDYQGTASEFASMARHGFLYQGQWYSWQKKGRGGVSFGLPSSRLVSFLENHDQVANTGVGSRLHSHSDHEQWRAMTALLLLGPALPLLFQGQEFGSSRPFAYFADHEPELASAVEKGRLEFLAQFPSLKHELMQQRIPKPAEVSTFENSKLSDEERRDDSGLKALHRDLLRLRRDDPVLCDMGTDKVKVESSAPTPAILLIRYVHDTGLRLLVVNFADDHMSAMNDPLLSPRPFVRWHSLWSSELPQYGGVGDIGVPADGPWLIPARSATLLASSPA